MWIGCFMQVRHMIIPYVPMLIPPKKWKGYIFLFYTRLYFRLLLSSLLSVKLEIKILNQIPYFRPRRVMLQRSPVLLCWYWYVSFLIFDILSGMTKEVTCFYLLTWCALMDHESNKRLLKWHLKNNWAECMR